jgi:catechol 2,3-dioxygenase-like lactoylglutathione lyase family enzyme
MAMTDAATTERPGLRPATVSRLHHLAYVTHDTEATVAFYTKVLGMPLVNAVLDDKVPSTGAEYPYFHSFFRMASGETIAFFECPGIPPAPPKAHPAYDDFEHLAMEVDSRAEVERWRQWLEQNGLKVWHADHGIIYSIYFFDPVNRIRLEITATQQANWNDRGEAAHAALAEWNATKRAASAAGEDVATALRALAKRRSAAAERAKQK